MLFCGIEVYVSGVLLWPFLRLSLSSCFGIWFRLYFKLEAAVNGPFSCFGAIPSHLRYVEFFKIHGHKVLAIQSDLQPEVHDGVLTLE